MWEGIVSHINRSTGASFAIESSRSVGGGSINSAYCLEGTHQKFFLKLNQAAKVSMFEAEAMGLNEMAATGAITVPRAICWGIDEGKSYIVLDWLDLGRSRVDWREMGTRLAQLHQTVSTQGFGWHQNNTIGDTPQINDWSSDWSEFYIKSRLEFQFKLAQGRGGHFKNQASLLEAVPQLLAGHQVSPALVHGDLWSGNAAFTVDGAPVIFDPATYYGDREVDIAMTELFGGFPQGFYDGYNSVYPIEPGYETRKILYNLYHVLNHFNLFGGGYLSQAERMIAQLLKAV